VANPTARVEELQKLRALKESRLGVCRTAVAGLEKRIRKVDGMQDLAGDNLTFMTRHAPVVIIREYLQSQAFLDKSRVLRQRLCQELVGRRTEAKALEKHISRINLELQELEAEARTWGRVLRFRRDGGDPGRA
jgi:hypothetical protein